jgi:hypothetical protein
MRIYHRMFTVALIISAFFNQVAGQKSTARFGNVDMVNLKAEQCPIDSNAHAYFIFDRGHSFFNYATVRISDMDNTGSKKGFRMHHERHFRIKIIDKQGFDWTDISIPLYRDKDEEEIGMIKACTYNLENGKMVKTKLSKEDIYIEETSKYWCQWKFAMPEVREGSIIEVEYTIISDYFFNLRKWAFQSIIPVLYSQYLVEIPEYFKYNQFQRGYYPFRTERGERSKSITLTYSETSASLNSGRESHTTKIDYLDNTLYYEASRVPAFPVEDYLRTEENYLTMVEFELSKIQYPQSLAKHYTTTWEDVDSKLEESSYFGQSLTRRGHLKESVEALRSSGLEGLEMASAAFSLVQEKMTWATAPIST